MIKIIFAVLAIWLVINFEETPNLSNTKGLILLSFDGYHPKVPVDIFSDLTASGLSLNQEIAIQKRVAFLYRKFDVIVTTDEKLFEKAPKKLRVRCVITSDRLSIPVIFLQSLKVRLLVAGLSHVNSFPTGDTTPCLISTYDYHESTRYLGDVIAHEVGHALGLRHKPLIRNGQVINSYDPGNSETAPIMGKSYLAKEALWTKAINVMGKMQDDEAIIAQTFHLRK